MTGDRANANGNEQLTLRSDLSELARVPPWIERLASQYAIPEKTQFAMNLCLEEALSNIVRHGYAAASGGAIIIHYAMPRSGVFVFVVDDEAPPFNPVEAQEPPIPNSLDDSQAGGQGIRLLRHFADTLQYERTPKGNRLSIVFSVLPDVEG